MSGNVCVQKRCLGQAKQLKAWKQSISLCIVVLRLALEALADFIRK